MTKRRRTRRGHTSSRAAMQALRRQPPAFDPCPPGPAGGRYKPLTEADMTAIYRTALRILAELGMGEAPPKLVEQAVAKGAFINGQGRLCYPPAMVEEIIAGAARRFPLFGRDPAHDFEIGGDRVYFGTGGAAVQVLDRDTGRYRPSTLRDLYDFARLAHALKNVAWFTRCCVATDVADNFALDINTAYAIARGTTKPIGTSFFIADHVAPVVALFDLVLGRRGRFCQRPFCKAHISPVISPLRYGADAVAVALEAMNHNMVLNNIIAAQSGATAPATIAGMLASTLAETLAALIMVNVFHPGYPMIFSNWPFVIDLRTGAFAGGGGEITLLNAASAQLSNWLGLPSGTASSMADAKAVDAQMGMEKALSSLAIGLAGGNVIYESSGMMASLLGASFEAFVIDDEMLSHVYRVIRGVEVNEHTLGFDAIREAVFGDGHFLGGSHTMQAMEREHFYPQLADRDDARTWAERGGKDIRARARQRVEDILGQPDRGYITPLAEQKIRDQFDILLAV